MTNGDRIRAMTDEELARWLCDLIFPECVVCPAYNFLSDCDGWCSTEEKELTTMLQWLRAEEVEK